METNLATRQTAGVAYRSPLVRVLSLLGPLVVTGGVLWAIVQPYRLTLLHPHHQGFWWLVIEPPLLVVAAGLFFALVVVRPLIADLEEDRGTTQ